MHITTKCLLVIIDLTNTGNCALSSWQTACLGINESWLCPTGSHEDFQTCNHDLVENEVSKEQKHVRTKRLKIVNMLLNRDS
jgi:hypothetical protein